MRIFLVAGVITLAAVLAVAAVGVVVAPDSFKLPQPKATVTVTAAPQVVATVTATATVTAIVSVAPSPAGTAIAGAGQTATPAPSSAPVPAGQWRKVASATGKTHAKSVVFRLRGDAQRLTWRLDGPGQPFAHIYVTEAGTGVFSSVPDAAPDTRGPGSATLQLDKGRYYLDVYSECTWSVTIWEQR